MLLFRRPVPSQLDRYIFRQLLLALLVSTGGLAALIWLTQSLRFLELVIDRGLSLRVFLELTSLLIPGFVAVILPITTFLVILFLYLRLAADREITVMRAAGLSHFALARPALGLAFVSLAACFWLNLGIVPSSVAAFRQEQFEIRNRIAAFLLQEGVFTPVSDNLTVYVRKRDIDGTLHGILVDDARDPNDQATILAESGRIADGPDGPEVLLFHGSRQVIDRRTGRLNVLTFAENTIDLTANGGGPQQRFRDASELPLGQLLHPDPATVAPRDRAKFRVEAFRRLSSPFTAVSFALLALYAVLAGAFRRHGGLLRTAAAVGGVVGLLAVQLAIADLAQRIPAVMPLIWVEAILPGLVFAWLLFAPPSHLSWRLRGARLGAPKLGAP
jgi:lipopolysaccharide export system permease protein